MKAATLAIFAAGLVAASGHLGWAQDVSPPPTPACTMPSAGFDRCDQTSGTTCSQTAWGVNLSLDLSKNCLLFVISNGTEIYHLALVDWGDNLHHSQCDRTGLAPAVTTSGATRRFSCAMTSPPTLPTSVSALYRRSQIDCRTSPTFAMVAPPPP
jgi:hypothetical protein